MRTVVFFATPSELASWVDEWRDDFALDLGVVLFLPKFELVPAAGKSQVDQIWKPEARVGTNVEELWLNIGPLNTQGRSSLEVRGDNEDCLVIHVPKMTDLSLIEADLGTVSRNRHCLKVWQR